MRTNSFVIKNNATNNEVRSEKKGLFMLFINYL